MAAGKLKSPLPAKVTRRELEKRIEKLEAGFLVVTEQIHCLGEEIRVLKMAKDERSETRAP